MYIVLPRPETSQPSSRRYCSSHACALHRSFAPSSCYNACLRIALVSSSPNRWVPTHRTSIICGAVLGTLAEPSQQARAIASHAAFRSFHSHRIAPLVRAPGLPAFSLCDNVLCAATAPIHRTIIVCCFVMGACIWHLHRTHTIEWHAAPTFPSCTPIVQHRVSAHRAHLHSGIRIVRRCLVCSKCSPYSAHAATRGHATRPSPTGASGQTARPAGSCRGQRGRHPSGSPRARRQALGPTDAGGSCQKRTHAIRPGPTPTAAG